MGASPSTPEDTTSDATGHSSTAADPSASSSSSNSNGPPAQKAKPVFGELPSVGGKAPPRGFNLNAPKSKQLVQIDGVPLASARDPDGQPIRSSSVRHLAADVPSAHSSRGGMLSRRLSGLLSRRKEESPARTSAAPQVTPGDPTSSPIVQSL